jgi:hypothetical protein
VSRCIQPGCHGSALMPWWLMCERCTLRLAEDQVLPHAITEQANAAGWDATEWAERIAPDRWGHGTEDDPWLHRLRALVIAGTVSARTQPCPHTAGLDVAVPVVLAARRPWVLACPHCAEQPVAETTTDGHACDRCAQVAVSPGDRAAILIGRSLIVVAQLCPDCMRAVVGGFAAGAL